MIFRPSLFSIGIIKKNLTVMGECAMKVNNYTTNMLLEEWSPKWKRFRPPMWKIFRWAYNIKKTLFTGVYPIACNSSLNAPMPPAPIEFAFTATPYHSEAVDAAESNIRQHYEEWLQSEK